MYWLNLFDTIFLRKPLTMEESVSLVPDCWKLYIKDARAEIQRMLVMLFYRLTTDRLVHWTCSHEEFWVICPTYVSPTYVIPNTVLTPSRFTVILTHPEIWIRILVSALCARSLRLIPVLRWFPLGTVLWFPLTILINKRFEVKGIHLFMLFFQQ